MPISHRNTTYSPAIGFIFLFNLIVGTGSLALPGALQNAGWVVGIILLIVLGAVSYITVTFVVESLAVANAISRKRYGDTSSTEGDTQRLLGEQEEESDVFDITEKYEIGQMAVLMSPKWSQVVIYGSLCLYLLGDLAIYAAVFGNSWARILCLSPTANGNNTSGTMTNDKCWQNSSLSVLSVYRLSILVFILAVGPFVFFNFQKTKFLQVFTALVRWSAFFIMITWSSYILIRDGKNGDPVVADYKALPTLFGTLVYSFMCQHSLPGLLHPVRNKNRLKVIIPLDYSIVMTFYLTLCLIAIFAFKEVGDLYPLNFLEEANAPNSSMFIKILSYFLAFFPVFTIATNYPLLGITLKNNFRSLILRDAPKKWYYDQFLFPLATIVPPTVLAIGISNLQLLLGIVGSYCGTFVQYLIPCLLVTFARYHSSTFDSANRFASPFKSKGWIYAVHVWMAISLIFITINFIRDLF